MDFFCFCVAEEGWGGMEIEWRWIIGSVGFGRGQQGETLAEGGGWVGRNVTEVGEGMGEWMRHKGEGDALLPTQFVENFSLSSYLLGFRSQGSRYRTRFM
jgi:hypothetical protein